MKKATIHKMQRRKQGIQLSSDDQKDSIEHNLLVRDPELVLYTKDEAAAILRVSLAAISAWITQKRLRPTKVGRRTTITHVELQRFLKTWNEPVDAASCADRTAA